MRARLFRAIDGAVDTAHVEALVARGKLTREGLDPASIRGMREKMERAAARRLQPHHIRSFFEAAFTEARGVAGAHAIAVLTPRHLAEVKDRRWSEIGKVEAVVKERLRRELVYLQHRALEVEAEERTGRKPRLNSGNLRRQCEALTDRLELRLADLEQQRDVAPLPPEVCGAALVAPVAWLARREAEAGADPGPAVSTDAAARAEVEATAMNAVRERERALGHEPRDVSAEDRGYDIKSREAGRGARASSRSRAGARTPAP